MGSWVTGCHAPQIADQEKRTGLEGVGCKGEQGHDDDIYQHDGDILVPAFEPHFIKDGVHHGPDKEAGGGLLEKGQQVGCQQDNACEDPRPPDDEIPAQYPLCQPGGYVAFDQCSSETQGKEDHNHHRVAEKCAEHLGGRREAAEGQHEHAEEAGPERIHKRPQVDHAQEDHGVDQPHAGDGDGHTSVHRRKARTQKSIADRNDHGRAGKNIAQKHESDTYDGMNDG